MVSAALVLVAEAAFIETFSGSALDPAWGLSFSETSDFRDNSPDTTWTPTVGGGMLRLDGFRDTTRNDSGWGIAYLTRPVTPVAGDFRLSMVFEWDLGDVYAMQSLRLRALDNAGVTVAAFSLFDNWFGLNPGYSFSGDDPGSSAGVPRDTLGFSSLGLRTIEIERIGGRLSATWDGATVYPDYDLVNQGVVSQLQIEISNFYYTTSTQGTRLTNIDAIELVAVPELGAVAWLLPFAVVVLPRRRRRFPENRQCCRSARH